MGGNTPPFDDETCRRMGHPGLVLTVVVVFLSLIATRDLLLGFRGSTAAHHLSLKYLFAK
jgi:hypothetical protein